MLMLSFIMCLCHVTMPIRPHGCIMFSCQWGRSCCYYGGHFCTDKEYSNYHNSGRKAPTAHLWVYVLLYTCGCMYYCTPVSVCTTAHLWVYVLLHTCECMYYCTPVGVCATAHLWVYVLLHTCGCMYYCTPVGVCTTAHLWVYVLLHTCGCMYYCTPVGVCTTAHLWMYVLLHTCGCMYYCTPVSVCTWGLCFSSSVCFTSCLADMERLRHRICFLILLPRPSWGKRQGFATAANHLMLPWQLIKL